MSCTYSEIQAFHCNSISLHLTFVGLDYQFSPKDMVAQKAQPANIIKICMYRCKLSTIQQTQQETTNRKAIIHA